MAQEIAHNLGLLHTGHVNSGVDPNCCLDGRINAKYPTTFGFDHGAMQVIAPGSVPGTHAHDFMSYGSGTIWVSDYSYEKLIDAPRVPAAAATVPAASISPAADQPYLFASGSISGTSATLNPFYVLDRPASTNDGAGSGSYALDLRDAGDRLLFTRDFEPPVSGHVDSKSFNEILPYDARTKRIVLRNGSQELASRTVSANAPTVNILTPAAGVHWDGARQVTWQASDADGDPLSFAVHYSADGGQTWLLVGVNLTGSSFNIDASLLAGSRNCLVRVVATDGINTTVATSGVFGVERHKPNVSIVSGPRATDNGQLSADGEGFDPEDGPLPDDKLVWSSDRDGVLGTGPSLVSQPLSPGPHVITLSGADSDGNQATVTYQIRIGNSVYLPLTARDRSASW